MEILAHVHAYTGHGHEAGAETTLHDMFRALVADGWGATVQLSGHVPGLKEPYVVDGVKVIPHSGDQMELPRAVSEADVVVSHLDQARRTSLVCRKERTPFVHLVHNTFPFTLGSLRAGFDLAVFNSEWVREHYVKKGLRRNKDLVLHPPVDPAKYAPAARGGKHDSVVMVNLFEMKGPEIFWAVARANPDLKFVRVKGGYERPDDMKTPQLDNVTVMPNSPGLLKPLRAARCVLMPSRYESFGRVAVEAAAAGIPTVASDVSGLREALGPKGLFCNQKIPSDFSQVIRALFEDDAFYQEAKAAAKARSAELKAQTDRELGLWVDKCNELGALNRARPPRSTYGSRPV